MVAQALPHAAWAAPVSRRVPVFGTFGRFHVSVPRRPICRAGKRNAPPGHGPFLDCNDRHRNRQSNDRDSIDLIGVEQAVSTLREQKGPKGSGAEWPWRRALALAVALVGAGLLHGGDVAHAAPEAVQLAGLVGDSPIQEGFLSGLLLIFFSEIGDKTFFVALLLALQRDRWTVFAGTFGALALMTVVSVALGLALHELDEVLPGLNALPLDDMLAIVLLVVFGVQTLRGAARAQDSAAEEKEEAEQAVSSLTGMGFHFAGARAQSRDDWSLLLSTFTLVFAAEWGDKSFLATIALAASSSPSGVVAGAVTGHGIATAIAVVGGSFLSDYISEQVAAYVGGSLFLVFAAATTLQLVHSL